MAVFSSLKLSSFTSWSLLWLTSKNNKLGGNFGSSSNLFEETYRFFNVFKSWKVLGRFTSWLLLRFKCCSWCRFETSSGSSFSWLLFKFTKSKFFNPLIVECKFSNLFSDKTAISSLGNFSMIHFDYLI